MCTEETNCNNAADNIKLKENTVALILLIYDAVALGFNTVYRSFI